MAAFWPGVRDRVSGRSMRLRSHLLVLTLGTLLPLLVFAVIASALFAERERETFRQGATQRTLALMTAVDAELGASVTALVAVAASRHLDADDLRAFHAEATRALASQPDWLTVSLAAPTAQQLVNVLRPFGAELPMIAERASFDRVVQTGRPAVSSLVYGSLTRQYHFTVRVPVEREGHVRYVLSAAVKPQAISRILSTQRLPPDWVGVVVDGNSRIVARTVESERTLGSLASESLRAALARAPEGWFHGSTIEGAEVYTPYNRSPWSGWALALGIPVSAVAASAQNTTWFMTAGLLLAASVALLLALALGRRIAAPIASLAEAAKALGRGERSSIARTSRVEEVGALGQALEDAAAAVRSREATLRESEERFAALVEGVPQLVWITAPDGAVEHFNRNWYEYTGATREHSLGHGWTHALHPEDRDRAWHLWQQSIQRGQPMEAEYRLRGADGRHQWFLARGVPFRDADGRILKWFGTSTNVETRKRAEESLQRADRAKDEFLAMLGHELRNPLGAIAGGVRVLEAVGKDDETAERARAVISRQVQHLSKMVDDLLDVSRVTTGKVILTRGPLDLAALVADAISGWRASGRLERHELLLEVSPAWIDADETRMEQVVSNLVGNALKYTLGGGRVVVRVLEDGDEVVLEVEDAGIGIPSNLLDSIFDLFVQGERASDRAQGGLGLGLTLVKILVELHGGTVRARSPGPGKGSVFTVRLPRITVPARAGRAAPADRLGVLRRRILVVEDNEDSREMLRVLLTLAGHEVHEAADGPAGLDLARKVTPDVALIDVGLPGLDGYEVARRLRAADEGGAVRLIAITGYGQAEDRQRALEAGFHAHLTKPVSPERLATAMADDAGSR